MNIPTIGTLENEDYHNKKKQSPVKNIDNGGEGGRIQGRGIKKFKIQIQQKKLELFTK